MKNKELKFIKARNDLSLWVQNFDDKKKVIAIDSKRGFRRTTWIMTTTIEAAVNELVTEYNIWRHFQLSPQTEDKIA